MNSLIGKRVLVVEDEALVAELVLDILGDMGALGVVAESVPQALEVLCRQGFDAAVLDVNLHGQASWPVARSLRQHDIPYLVVSGYGVPPDEIPGAHVLAKPYSVNDFMEAVAALVPPLPVAAMVTGGPAPVRRSAG